VPLTALPGWADFPVLSPDGTRVAFEWNGEQQFTAFDLYVKTIGNENLLRLTNDPAVHLAPHGLQMANRLLFNESPRTAGHLPRSGSGWSGEEITFHACVVRSIYAYQLVARWQKHRLAGFSVRRRP
jgi:hypothetical protein